MEKRYNQLKKEKYATDLAKSGNIKRAKEIVMQDDYLPLLKPLSVHAETEITSNQFNEFFTDIGIDLDIINTDIASSADRFKNLLETTKLELDNIKTVLKTEKERQEDINILCNRYTDFSNVILVSNKNSITDLDEANGALTLKVKSSKNISCKIEEVSGNGYEGNMYVYKNGAFISNISRSSNREYATDNSLLTYYEYSRITANNSEPEVFPLVNFDSINARCSILIKGFDTFNTLEVTNETDDIILESLSTSMDGQTFAQSSLTEVPITNKKARFNSEDYIYGSGMLSFKDSMYVKLVIRASKNTNDSIAFNKKNIDGTTKTIQLKSAKRSAVKINNISIGNKEYVSQGKLVFNKFITDPVRSIAIFANEYIADGFDLRKSVKYTLTVNGIDYDIIPINSNHNGKKIIRTTNMTIPAEHVHYLSESIKDATLTINVKTTNKNITPYISDIKILVGGE